MKINVAVMSGYLQIRFEVEYKKRHSYECLRIGLMGRII